MKRPKLALTLRRIAENPTSLYDGPLANDIVADIQERG
jgi:gamma-glutamyltranspeptidase